MSSELMLLCMKFQANWNSWLGKFPIEWQEKHHNYKYNRNLRDLKFFYFSILCLLGLLVATLLVTVFRYFQPHPEFTATYYLIYFLAVVPAVGGFMAFGVSVIMGQDAVMCSNETLQHYRGLRGGKRNFKPPNKRYPWGIKGWIEEAKDICKTDDGSWDLLGVGMIYFCTWSLWLPFAAGLIGSFIDLNPIKWLCYDLLGRQLMSTFKARIAVVCYSFILYVIVTAQVVRIFQIGIILGVIPLQILIKALTPMDNLFKKGKLPRDFRYQILEYTKGQLINDYVNISILDTICFPVIEALKFLGVFALFITLKLNNYLLPVIWITSGCGSLVVILVVNLVFPNINKLYDASSNSLRNWKRGTNPHNRHLMRKYKTLRPYYCNAGMFGMKLYLIDRSTLTGIFSSMLDQIINLMIAYPQSELDAIFLKV